MAGVKVAKGKFVALRGLNESGAGDLAVRTRFFMFNPNDVDDNKETDWGRSGIPGASHPVVSYGSGGARLINFTLYFDGDRGRSDLRKNGGTAPLSIADELCWYRALVYPIEYGMDMAKVFPFIVLFSMGPLYQRVPVIIRAAPWKITFWTPKMEPVKGSIPIQLEEVPVRSQTVEDIWRIGGIGT